MAQTTSDTWTIRLDSEFKKELKTIVEQDFDNTEEFMKSMLASFKLQKLKDVDEAFVVGVTEMDHHLNGIMQLYATAIEGQKTLKGFNAEYINQLLMDLHQLKEANEILEGQNKQLNHSLEMKEIEIATLKGVQIQLQQGMDAQQGVINELKNQLSIRSEQIAMVNQENHRLRERISSAEEGLDKYRNQSSLSQINWDIKPGT